MQNVELMAVEIGLPNMVMYALFGIAVPSRYGE